MRIRLGTRGSRLARAQSGDVARLLEGRGHQVEMVIVKTAGDQQQGVPFAQIGAPGVFVREIERALLEEQIDLAVHSYKDLPSKGPAELVVAAVPERVDPGDLLLFGSEARATDPVLPLRRGARVGTASARRRALLADLRPDLEIELLRGNVPTRIEKLAAGDYDAIVLAAAGVTRLERHAEREGAEPLPGGGLERLALAPGVFVPAPSQGALAIQVRAADAAVRAAAAELEDPAARRAVDAERALLTLVEGDCDLPFGAWCAADGAELVLRAVLGGEGPLVRVQARAENPEELAHRVWEQLRAQTRISG